MPCGARTMLRGSFPWSHGGEGPYTKSSLYQQGRVRVCVWRGAVHVHMHTRASVSFWRANDRVGHKQAACNVSLESNEKGDSFSGITPIKISLHPNLQARDLSFSPWAFLFFCWSLLPGTCPVTTWPKSGLAQRTISQTTELSLTTAYGWF